MEHLTIPSPNMHAGRTRPVRLIVLHTAQAPCRAGSAEGVARFLARPEVKASCHWSVDPDVIVAQVDESDTAWAAPGANADGIQIEQAAYAEFGSGAPIPAAATAARAAHGDRWPDWSDPEAQRMLRTKTAPLVAEIAARWGIPLVALTAEQVAAGKSGVCDHNAVAVAYALSDHWDCGRHYPLHEVVALARAWAGNDEEDDDMPLNASDLATVRHLVAEQVDRAAGNITQALADRLNAVAVDITANVARHIAERGAEDRARDERIAELVSLGGGVDVSALVDEIARRLAPS